MPLTEAQQFVLGKVHSRVKFLVGNKTDIPKILLIKLGAVGELVMASPFFDQLRKHFPHSEIVLVAGRSFYAVVEHNPNISRFILADDLDLYRGGLIRRSLEFFRLICKLRKEDFELSFILERGMTFRLLSCLAGIPVRVGFGRGRKDFFLTHSVPGHRIQNESESYLDLLRKMDIPAVFEKTFYYLSDEEKEFMDLFLERHSIVNGEQVIAVAPGGGSNARSNMIGRHWPVQNYIELIQRLKDERSSRILLVGEPDDREITNTIIQSCPDCLDATDLSFGEMASIFRGCSLLIGNDYARNHIAVAMGIPAIRIFNPGDSRPSTSFDIVNDTSAAPVKPSPSLIGGKFSKSSDPEFPVTVSVDEVWQHLKTMGGYCQ
ncbi:glycosyltransferase family 9 protein [Nitrospinaceae bacterium]|nr:glycosyltransferase family 9 protein [Nitrospinaceae bacterium]